MNHGISLRLDDIRFSFEAMRMRFDIDVVAGEWLAVIGPSGAGKSTLLDLVAGFLAPDAGRILIDGRNVTPLAPAERPVSFVFQENNLFAHLDAFRNVGLGISPSLRLTEEQKAAVALSLERVGLAGLESRRPGEMSGGERQRVALARAFVRDRPLLLLDEPFAALGPALRGEMLMLLKELRESSPMTVLMVTHHPEDARGHADRIAFVEAGQIAALGATERILEAREEPRVAAYLGERGLAK